MDIMDQPVISSSDTKHYRRHSTAFKLALVEQTLQPGASVARIAREHGVNANQVFGWRKLYREGLLDSSADASAAMLPVTIMATDSQNSDSSCFSSPKPETANVLRLECARGCLIIEGVPDRGILDRVLDRLLR
jgi:transposase